MSLAVRGSSVNTQEIRHACSSKININLLLDDPSCVYVAVVLDGLSSSN